MRTPRAAAPRTFFFIVPSPVYDRIPARPLQARIYIIDSFNLNKVTLNDEGSVTGSQTPVDLTGKLSFGEGNKSFSINLGNEMGTAQLWLTYESTYIPGTTIKNKAKIQYDGTSAQSIATYTDQGAGGTAGGDLDVAILIRVVSEYIRIIFQKKPFFFLLA